MSCSSVRRDLHFYLDSELGPDASLAMAHHLESCAACRLRMEGERELEELFRVGLGPDLTCATRPTC